MENQKIPMSYYGNPLLNGKPIDRGSFNSFFAVFGIADLRKYVYTFVSRRFVDLYTIKRDKVVLGWYKPDKHEIKLEEQVLKVNLTGITDVNIHSFNFDVFAIEVIGTSVPYQISLNNCKPNMISKNGVFMFENLAKIMDEDIDELRLCIRIPTKSTREDSCFAFSFLPYEKMDKGRFYRFVKEGQNSYVNFNYTSEAYLIFTKPVYSSIDIIAYTYRAYYKGTNRTVLV